MRTKDLSPENVTTIVSTPLFCFNAVTNLIIIKTSLCVVCAYRGSKYMLPNFENEVPREKFIKQQQH